MALVWDPLSFHGFLVPFLAFVLLKVSKLEKKKKRDQRQKPENKDPLEGATLVGVWLVLLAFSVENGEYLVCIFDKKT